MVCFDMEKLRGEWQLLDSSNVRRRAVLKCTTPMQTSSAGTCNITFAEGEMVQVMSIDGDGGCMLQDTGVDALFWLSHLRKWLLDEAFHNFNMWVLEAANSSDAEAKREHRNRKELTPDD